MADVVNIIVDKGNGITDIGTIIEKLKCPVCQGEDLDIYIVENEVYERTQAYQCRNCKTVKYFGVSE